MGRHSADAASGPPGYETGPLGPPAAYESGTQPAIGPPGGRGKRKRMIVAIGLTLVGVALLVFGFISLTSTEDPPSTASQDTATTPAPTQTSTATDPATTSAAGSTPAAPGTPGVLPVTVLNASPDLTPGLATRVAEALEEAGWPIAEISNFDATVIEETTAYFTPGNAAEEAAAQALVAQFPEIAGGARPRFDGLGGSGLTVAVVGDWLP